MNALSKQQKGRKKKKKKKSIWLSQVATSSWKRTIGMTLPSVLMVCLGVCLNRGSAKKRTTPL